MNIFSLTARPQECPILLLATNDSCGIYWDFISTSKITGRLFTSCNTKAPQGSQRHCSTFGEWEHHSQGRHRI